MDSQELKDQIVSVIVPVYNVEKYLAQCLDSIINQTYKQLQIILVDDGSTDKSGKICDEYAENDSRINVIHKENGGVSSARNMGLDHATGEYISFIDADDWLEIDMYRRMIDALKSDGAQMVSCNTNVIQNGRIVRFHSQKLTDSTAENQEIYTDFIGQTMALWNKLFKADKVKKIRFNEKISYSEDLLYIINVLIEIDKTTTISYVGYNYRVDREGNVISSDLQDKHMTQLNAGIEIYHLLHNKEKEAQQLSVFCCTQIFNNLCNRILNSVKLNQQDKNRYINRLKDFAALIHSDTDRYAKKRESFLQSVFLKSPKTYFWIIGIKRDYRKFKSKVKQLIRREETT